MNQVLYLYEPEYVFISFNYTSYYRIICINYIIVIPETIMHSLNLFNIVLLKLFYYSYDFL